ncbi:hypothetical protein D6C00_01100 [Thiohalobacter thiocyanaticus]|uniref:NADH-quinone oxidoreductase subunit G n=1 Tax=Thiohalobacter thiocyanaticus TaxID=585455 RepID=A0A426QG44_9GAMM|nr:hypothetical protein D6C00_01100 [Thiohalobacter thiocyanaticus]
MSATPEIPPEDAISIEINGRTYPARKGQMLIEITDEHGITVPRFCYHKKLPIAANCRMCLVQVDKAPKPLPACATPVADGMKIWTDSDYAREAQKSVMEFLLINHPLDCPICDQGGECELQDGRPGVWPQRLTIHREEARGQGRGPGFTDLHRYDPLHPLYPVRAIPGCHRRVQGAGRRGPRREHGHPCLRGPGCEFGDVGQCHRHLPGGCAHLQTLPLPRPGLGTDSACQRGAARLCRLEPLPACPARRSAAGGTARERGDQRGLAVGPRPFQLRRAPPRERLGQPHVNVDGQSGNLLGNRGCRAVADFFTARERAPNQPACCLAHG